MRAKTLVRACIVVMFLASLGVAGTTIVKTTAQTFLAQTDLDRFIHTAEASELEDVQADQLERQLRSYQVRLLPTGEIAGRVNVVDPLSGGLSQAQDMTISFLQEGAVIAETRPGLEGRFEVALQPGVYAVVGAGPDGYVAFSMQVLPAELTVDNGGPLTQPVAFQEVMEELAIDSVAVPVSDLPTVIDLARANIPPELLQPEPSGEGMTTGPPIQLEGVSNRADVALQGHQVQIRPDGTLEGRIHRINQDGEPTRIRRVNVFLVQNNEVIAQAPVDELGSFSFFDVNEGVYSFVAAGVDGIAAFTMQAVSGPGLAGVADELILPVAVNTAAGDGSGSLNGGPNTGPSVNSAQNTVNGGNGNGGEGEGGEGEGGEGEGGEGEGGEGNGGGGSSGVGGTTAGGGGFGSGAGGGLWEALLAGGLIAAAAIAAAENNNDDRRITNSSMSSN